MEGVDEELRRRVGEINQRANLAKRMIQKKQHQLLLKEITNKQPRVSRDAIDDLESKYRTQLMGEDGGRVQIVLSQRKESFDYE